MPSPSTVIAGGGVIGLSLALELQKRGRAVTVLERHHCGDVTHGAATPASAGILGTDDPGHPAQMQELCSYSYALYPEFLARLAELSGRAVPFDHTHLLEAFADCAAEDDRERGELLNAEQLRELEPELIPGDAHWYRREEPSLDPRLLCAALLAACRAAGVDVRENEPVMSLTFGANEVSLHTPHAVYVAEQFCLAAGAWSGGLLGAQDFAPLVPTVPRRGQILCLQLPQHPIRHAVRPIGCYLVPRATNLLIGSTVEFAGFEVATQPEVIDSLQALIAQSYPALASVQRLDQWAGLRPGTPDDLPILGALPQPGCFVSTGHFRNGILLAPGSAQVMADLMDSREPQVALDAFLPGRFTHGEE